eukprot:12105428-Heterocapsa_arctica.AAC.1
MDKQLSTSSSNELTLKDNSDFEDDIYEGADKEACGRMVDYERGCAYGNVTLSDGVADQDAPGHQ